MEWFNEFWSVYSNLVLNLGIGALLALSIYLTLACGMLTLANAAFMGIGAYTSALLSIHYELAFPLVLLAGMAAPAVVAFLIGKPTLRLSGVYLAMATLGFGEVVRVVLLNTKWSGGALGLSDIPQLTQWWHVLFAVLLVVALLYRLRRSRVGRAFEAIKEDEIAAGLMGINVGTHKMFAFVLGAMIAGLAGALNAHLTYFIGPNEYGFDRGVEILTMAVLGGVSNLIGPIVGSFILTLLPEVLRSLGNFRLIVNGLILVLIVLFLPKGIWDPMRIRRLLRWFGKTREA